MPATYPELQSLITQKAGFARITPVTLTDGKVSGVGTAIDCLIAKNEKPTYANADTASKEYNELELSGDRKLRRTKTLQVFDVVTGEKVEAGDTSDVDQITAELILSKTEEDSLLELKGEPLILTIGIGFLADGSYAGTEHILGKFSGNIEPDVENEYRKVPVTVAGESYAADDLLDVATLNAAIAEPITPTGMSEITIAALIEDDMTKLLTGAIVRK